MRQPRLRSAAGNSSGTVPAPPQPRASIARHSGVPGWRSLPSRVDWPRVGSALRLSRRELELVRHIFDGKKLAAIAKEMKLALGTVKTYSQRIHLKLDVTDQRELALAVLEAHLRFRDAIGAPDLLKEKV